MILRFFGIRAAIGVKSVAGSSTLAAFPMNEGRVFSCLQSAAFPIYRHTLNSSARILLNDSTYLD